MWSCRSLRERRYQLLLQRPVRQRLESPRSPVNPIDYAAARYLLFAPLDLLQAMGQYGRRFELSRLLGVQRTTNSAQRAAAQFWGEEKNQGEWQETGKRGLG
jgi:hypothetical protein